LLMVAVMLVVTVVGLTVVVGVGYVVGAHRVRVAADLAALSGAAAVQMGEDACAAARRIAAGNNARLTACKILGDQIEFVVQVTVVVDVPHPPVGLPKHLSTSAQAGVLQP
jgi:secretion/DNA translocation related TadE-like protein